VKCEVNLITAEDHQLLIEPMSPQLAEGRYQKTDVCNACGATSPPPSEEEPPLQSLQLVGWTWWLCVYYCNLGSSCAVE